MLPIFKIKHCSDDVLCTKKLNFLNACYRLKKVLRFHDSGRLQWSIKRSFDRPTVFIRPNLENFYLFLTLSKEILKMGLKQPNGFLTVSKIDPTFNCSKIFEDCKKAFHSH